MNPEELAKSGTEHSEQRALFAWANMAERHGFTTANDMDAYNQTMEWLKRHQNVYGIAPIPELKWLHAIPNAGARGNRVAASQLKAEGVKAGVADTFLPVKRSFYEINPVVYSGLYIELKRANGLPSDLSPEQKEFGAFVESQGFAWCVCFGWRHAAARLQQYLTPP